MTSPPSNKKITKTVTKTINDSEPMASLRAKLKIADPEIQHYAAALEAENLKCAKKVGKLQADNVALNNRITILIEENEKKEREATANLSINLGVERPKK